MKTERNLHVERELRQDKEKAETDMNLVIRQAYTVIYVEGMLRAEREGVSFEHAIHDELFERGLIDTADSILQYERLRMGLGIRTGEAQ